MANSYRKSGGEYCCRAQFQAVQEECSLTHLTVNAA